MRSNRSCGEIRVRNYWISLPKIGPYQSDLRDPSRQAPSKAQESSHWKFPLKLAWMRIQTNKSMYRSKYPISLSLTELLANYPLSTSRFSAATWSSTPHHHAASRTSSVALSFSSFSFFAFSAKSSLSMNAITHFLRLSLNQLDTVVHIALCLLHVHTDQHRSDQFVYFLTFFKRF